ncbi:MAG: hypothetical protein CMH98_04905 [Oceanospirillaceae bacterium]|nr:hypothetical protein [Oceanospirillaceae bacterium]
MHSAFAAVLAELQLRRPFERAMHSSFAAVPHWVHATQSAYAEAQLRHPFEHAMHTALAAVRRWKMHCARPARRITPASLRICGALGPAEIRHWEHAMCPVTAEVQYGNVRGARSGRGTALGTCEALGLAEVQLW